MSLIVNARANHAMILPHDANPKPDRIFGKDRLVACVSGYICANAG
jgi:hypothetical protein